MVFRSERKMDIDEEETEANISIVDTSVIHNINNGTTEEVSKLRRSSRMKKVVHYVNDSISYEEHTQKLVNDFRKISSSTPLETIFEEPKVIREQLQYMSNRRYKRLKPISEGTYKPLNSTKKKKLIKAGVNKKYKKKGNISLETVLSKLTEIND